jgi:outer membrane protein assembly factor BamB
VGLVRSARFSPRPAPMRSGCIPVAAGREAVAAGEVPPALRAAGPGAEGAGWALRRCGGPIFSIQLRSTSGAASLVRAIILTALGLSLAPATGRAAGCRVAAPARIIRVIDLPGYSGLIDPDGRTIYLVRDITRTSQEIVAFDWRRRRTVWRAPDKGPLWPAGISPSALVLANYPQGGPVTAAPLAGLDRRTGRILWRQPNEAFDREGLIGIAVVGDRIFKALPGRLACLRAASGREVWVRDFGSHWARVDWPYAPAAAAGSVFAQVVVEGTRVVALDARDGQTRWSHAFPWAVSFEGPLEVRRVGPLAAAGNSVVALIPTGPQPVEPGGPGVYPPPSALYCWDARTGRLQWRQSVPWTNESLQITTGVVALSPEPGTLIGYSLDGGRELWRFNTHLANSPTAWLAAGREIVMGALSNPTGARITGAYVLAVDAATGKLKWRVRLPRATDVNAISVRAAPGKYSSSRRSTRTPGRGDPGCTSSLFRRVCSAGRDDRHLFRLGGQLGRVLQPAARRGPIQWRQGGKLWPLAKFRRRFERPDRVRRALARQTVGGKAQGR